MVVSDVYEKCCFMCNGNQERISTACHSNSSVLILMFIAKRIFLSIKFLFSVLRVGDIGRQFMKLFSSLKVLVCVINGELEVCVSWS